MLGTSPQVAAAVAVTIIFGAVGAAYPDAFLAEPRAPGVIGGAILGIAGAAFAGVLWSPVLGAWVGGESFRSRRIFGHLNGQRIIVARAGELVALATVTTGVAITGAVGGMVASAAQPRFAVGAPVRLAPSTVTVIIALCVCLGGMLVGWALALALRSTTAASAAYFVGVAMSMFAAGLIYFSPAAKTLAALMPFSLLVSFSSDQFYARQYLGQHATTLTWVVAAVWCAGLAALVGVRARNRVG